MKSVSMKTASILIASVLCLLSFASCSNSSNNNATTAGQSGTAAPPPTTLMQTTLMPTTPPPQTSVVATYDMKDYSDSNPFFSGMSPDVSSVTYNGQYADLVSTGGDPFAISPELDLDTTQIDIIRLVVQEVTSDTGLDSFEFFNSTDQQSWAGGNEIRDYYTTPGQFETIDVDTRSIDWGWVGTLKQLRYDFLEEPGEVQIQSISFLHIDS